MQKDSLFRLKFCDAHFTCYCKPGNFSLKQLLVVNGYFIVKWLGHRKLDFNLYYCFNLNIADTFWLNNFKLMFIILTLTFLSLSMIWPNVIYPGFFTRLPLTIWPRLHLHLIYSAIDDGKGNSGHRWVLSATPSVWEIHSWQPICAISPCRTGNRSGAP